MEQSSTVQEFEIEEDQELRFEVGSTEVVVELIEGMAEIFGSELILNKRYTFYPGTRVAIYSWHGCKVELAGDADAPYVAKQTPMLIYLNTHAALEQMREYTASLIDKGEKNARGPRLMVVGPTDAGKSTMCRILLNYATRLGRSPIFIDLDVGQGSISVPGTIGSLFVERPADPVEGFDKRAPLLYHFGHISPSDNMALYNNLIMKLAEVVNAKCHNSQTAKIGGVIINTCGWIKGDGYGALLKAAEEFEIDVVVVLDHERLYNELQKDLPSFVKIVHQPKSGGIEDRNFQTRLGLRRGKIREYFYGTKKSPMFPHSFDIKFHEIQIYKVGAPQLPESCLPVGMKAEDTRTKLVLVLPTEQLKNRLLSVSLCERFDADVLYTNVAGFICVSDINMERQTLTILSPQPYPLPRHIMLLTEIEFLDSMH